jgi:LemA protein
MFRARAHAPVWRRGLEEKMSTLSLTHALVPTTSWRRAGLRVALLAFMAAALSACGWVNRIPTLDEASNAAWSEVQNQYQRRADLVPNLVETVRGYAAQERETLQAVVEARAKATQMTLPGDITTNPEAFAQFQANQAQLSSALARLLAVVEAYPDLKANQNFLSLQSQLEGTENRIAVARRDYILAVQAYNTEVRTFPGRLVAMLYGAEPKQTFTTAPENQTAPRVQF